MPMTDPRELFLHELKDVYFAENAAREGPPRDDLRGLRQGAREGPRQPPRRRRASRSRTSRRSSRLSVRRPKAEKCPGIEGIKAEHDEFIKKERPSSEIRDMFLTGAAARAEHYEIAAYNGLDHDGPGPRRARVRRSARPEPEAGEGGPPARRVDRQADGEGRQGDGTRLIPDLGELLDPPRLPSFRGGSSSPRPRTTSGNPPERWRVGAAGAGAAGRGRSATRTRRVDGSTTSRRSHGSSRFVIPPAWRDVWISPSPTADLQATGVDAAGRRQYLYHPPFVPPRSRRSTTGSCGSASSSPTSAGRPPAMCGASR